MFRVINYRSGAMRCFSISFFLIACLPATFALADDVPVSGIYMVEGLMVDDPAMRDQSPFDFLDQHSHWDWLEYDAATGKAQVFSPWIVKPATYQIDFDTGKVVGRIPFLPPIYDFPLSSVTALTKNSFLLTGNAPFSWSYHYQRVETDDPEYVQAARTHEQMLADTQAERDEKRAALEQRLTGDAPALPSLKVKLANLPFSFDLPLGITFKMATINVENLGAEFSHDGFTLGSLTSPLGQSDIWMLPWQGRAEVGSTVATYLGLSDAEASLHLTDPERSITLYYDDFDQLQIVGQIRTGPESGLIFISSGIGEVAPENVLPLFKSLRPDTGGAEPIPAEQDLSGLSSFVLAPDSIAAIHQALNGPDPVSAVMSDSAWDVTRPVLVDEKGDSFQVRLNFALETGAGLSGPADKLRGDLDSALMRVDDDGNCESKIAFPVTTTQGETQTYLTATIAAKTDPFISTIIDDRGYCIMTWSALRASRSQLPKAVSSEMSGTAMANATEYDDVLPLDSGFTETRRNGLKGLLAPDGAEILPPEFESITVYPSAILTEQEQGDRLFARDGTPIINQPEDAIWPIEELPDYFAAHSQSADGASHYRLIRTTDGAILISDATDLRFLADRAVFLIGESDGNEAIVDLGGTRIGSDRNKGIKPLPGTPNYLVEDAEAGLFHIADAAMTRQPQPYSSAWPHYRPRLISVSIPDDEKAYIDFDGNRITPAGMVPEYAPSDDGYITVYRNRRSFLGIMGTMQQRWGLLDRQGNVVIPLDYDQLHQAREGVVPVRQGRNFAVFSVDGTALTDFKWRNLTLSYGGGIMAQEYSKWRLIDHSGRILDRHEFDNRPRGVQVQRHDTDAEIDVFAASIDGKFGLITGDGEVLVPFDYAAFDPSLAIFTDAAGQEHRYPHDFR